MSKGGTFRWSKYSHRFLTLPEWYSERAAHETPVARADLPCPMIISDCTDGIKSMADGKIYTSKRAYEASVKAQGLEIVGNSDLSKYTADPHEKFNTKQHVEDIERDVKTAIEQVEAKL